VILLNNLVMKSLEMVWPYLECKFLKPKKGAYKGERLENEYHEICIGSDASYKGKCYYKHDCDVSGGVTIFLLETEASNLLTVNLSTCTHCSLTLPVLTLTLKEGCQFLL